uniref:Uncharacterized protein n=1 Tax=Alexandrium monilatum TaxID=311494 RepID=A0A7S4PRV3_9DINO
MAQVRPLSAKGGPLPGGEAAMAAGGEAEPAPAATPEEEELSAMRRLSALLGQVRDGEFDAVIDALDKRRRRISWERLPSKIVLLRHGESEGNVDHLMYTYKGDSCLELTPRGRRQAEEAGARLKEAVGSDKIFVCLSPFERTQQTYVAACKGGFPADQVGVLHVDPQIREQEFGNFQDPGLTSKVRAEEKKVGRFYYRRPDGESSADVFDRVNQFWDRLTSDGNDALLLSRMETYDTCLVVTHGLTIRLLLMRIFDWSVETFETVFNIGNCNHLTLRKNMTNLSFELNPEECFPPRLPWASREVRLVFKALKASEETEEKLRRLQQLCELHSVGDLADTMGLDRAIDELEGQRLLERSRPYTIVDYLAVPRPRTAQTLEVLARVVPGHGLRGSPEELVSRVEPVSVEELEFIDWWGDRVGYRGKMLRSQVTPEHEPSWSIHNRTGSRDHLDGRMAGIQRSP